MRKHRGPTGVTTRADTPLAVGFRCGRLTVIGLPFMLAKGSSEIYAVCQCVCGNTKVLRGHSLMNSVIRSCGCDKGDNKKHGDSKARLYDIWCHMKTRCSNQKAKQWEYYGGRGIRVCDEWAGSYEVFRDWAISNGYKPSLELDRRDVNGNYEPDNCRWANRCQQMANTRKRRDARTSTYKGVSWCANAGKWRTQINSNNRHIHVGVYCDEVDAAKAYDEAAARIHGEYAVFNFPRKAGASF